jgi:hypothetical protein
VRCAPIGRSSRVGSEFENVRIRWSHGRDWFLGFWRMRGAIKRHSGAERKLERALCPIHTMRRANPDQAADWCLTDRGQIARCALEKGKFWRGLNFIRAPAYSFPRVASPRLALDQIKTR